MAKRSTLSGQLKLVLAISTIHIVVWLTYLSQTPLGQYPTAEEQQTIETALALSQGGGPDGFSFTLYEFGLSIVARFISSETEITLIARAVNAIALLLTTLLCARATGQYWKKIPSLWIAGLLTGLNPVLAFWAGNVSPALLCVLAATFCYTRLLLWIRNPTPKRSLVIGTGLSIGGAFDSSLILVTIGWLFFAYIYPKRKRLTHVVAATSLPALMALAIALPSFQLQDALGTSLSNVGSGIYQTLNSHEAFDGKSYSLHNNVNSFLFVNPIHWGALFILALAGCWIRIKNGNNRTSIVVFFSVLALFALNSAINDAGSQTRALFYPILTIYAGGVYYMPRAWRRSRRQTRRKLTLGVLATAILAYSDFLGARSPENWEQDYILLANANLSLQQNESASDWAKKALEINPDRKDMQSILVRTTFSEWALSPNPTRLTPEDAKVYLKAAQEAQTGTPEMKVIEALYHFKLRNADHAIKVWRENQTHSALALICLYWTGNETKPRPSEIEKYKDDPYFDLLAHSIEINRNSIRYSDGAELLDNMLANAH